MEYSDVVFYCMVIRGRGGETFRDLHVHSRRSVFANPKIIGTCLLPVMGLFRWPCGACQGHHLLCLLHLDQSWWYGDMLGFVAENGIATMTFLCSSDGIIVVPVVPLMGLLW